MRYLNKLLSIFLSTLLLSCLSLSANATTTFDKASIDANFNKIGLKVSAIEKSPIEGVFEITTQQGVLYSNAKGDHFIQGKLYGFNDEGGLVDYAAKKNVEQLKAIEDEMIIFKSPTEKYAVTIFTDITCGYCTKLHKEMQNYLDKGITIRYLAFPRSGPDSDTGYNMAKVWCAADRKTALDKVKLNKDFNFDGRNLSECQAEIAKHYQLGVDFGVRGTPAIILEDGSMVGGYLPADKLLSAIEGR